jgi:N-acetylneuraminate lyase
MHTPISGLIAATVTGYHPDGSVNLEIIPRYAEMLCANRVGGVFINGTTGEGLSLTLRERK